MIKPFRLHVQTLRPLEAGPLAPHLTSFAALLGQQRYCRVTGWNKLRLVAALSHWMVQTKLRLKDLNERRVAKFLGWRWRHYVYHSGDKCTPALLLQHLRQLDVIPPPMPAPLTPIDVIERAAPHRCAANRPGRFAGSWRVEVPPRSWHGAGARHRPCRGRADWFACQWRYLRNRMRPNVGTD